MLQLDNIPPVDDGESLARFIVSKSEFRPSDMTIKPQAFMPYSRVELSVTRHLECSRPELCQIGRDVAAQREKSLYGWSDIFASICRQLGLNVDPQPIPDSNPNHANITGYPPKKEEQMALAQKIAKTSSKLQIPSTDANPAEQV